MAGLTTLLKHGLAAPVVPAQLKGGQKTPDNFVPPYVRRRADQLDGALLEGWVRVLPQGHGLQEGQIAALDNAAFKRSRLNISPAPSARDDSTADRIIGSAASRRAIRQHVVGRGTR